SMPGSTSADSMEIRPGAKLHIRLPPATVSLWKRCWEVVFSLDMWYCLSNNVSMSTSTLLVLGAGPKAVSIAAKRHMLAKLGYPVPHLHIIDRQGVASHWSGQAGFTDGNQFLGTRPEKDIGFPYLSACWGDKAHSRAVAKEMLHLSWPGYLIDQLRYADWIDRGRTRPTHSEWSKYIRWVAGKVGLDLCVAEVIRIGTTADQKDWQLTCQSSTGGTPFTP